jgi:hypothetical protein
MFYLVTLTAVASFFFEAGEVRETKIYDEASAKDALVIARAWARNELYKAVGIKVGNGRKAKILWVK